VSLVVVPLVCQKSDSFFTFTELDLIKCARPPNQYDSHQGEVAMDEYYKAHFIRSIAMLTPDTKLWNPQVKIAASNEDRGVKIPITGPKVATISAFPSFPTQEEAEKHALEFAKKWIDNGKPDLS